MYLNILGVQFLLHFLAYRQYRETSNICGDTS